MIIVRLKELLAKRGISQRELARRTGKHHDVISRFAREATGQVSYDLLDAICEALDCTTGDLIEYVSPDDEQIPLFDRPDPRAKVGSLLSQQLVNR